MNEHPSDDSAGRGGAANEVVLHPEGTLSSRQQTINAICYFVIISITYFAAPIIYVDVVHSALVDKLGASKTVANLPTTMGTFFGIIPLIVAWWLPYTRLLKPVLVGTWLIGGAGALALPVVLLLNFPASVCITMAVLHGGLIIATLGVNALFMWEVFIRGTSEAKRGKTFSLAFGLGPLFAVAGSQVVQQVLTSKIQALQYPNGFAALFLAASILMFILAFVCSRFRVPMAGAVVSRQPFGEFMFGGFGHFFTNRLLISLAVANLLFNTAFFAINNASLNVRDVLGIDPDQLSGWVSTLRFGTKGLAGFFLGWLLARYGSRCPAVGTSLLMLSATLWVLVVPGWAYMAGFGLFGAGELCGLYYSYYVAAASRPDRIKRNVAIYNLVGLLGYFSAFLHGRAADLWGINASFALAAGSAVIALLIIIRLSPRPEPTA